MRLSVSKQNFRFSPRLEGRGGPFPDLGPLLCHEAKSHHPHLIRERDSNVQKPSLRQLTSPLTVFEIDLPGQGQPPYCPQTARNNRQRLQRRWQARTVRSGPGPCQGRLQGRQTLGHTLSGLACLSGSEFVLEYFKTCLSH